jgi:hypothetical protein
MSRKEENRYVEETESKDVFFGLLGTEHVHTIKDRVTGDYTIANSYVSPEDAKENAWDKFYEEDEEEDDE